MITNLHIKNIGIIDDLEIDLNKGMNVLTGETGAGKTLIIDSISIISGGRFSKEMIRKGENHSYVELCMYVPNDVNSVDGNIIVTREIYNNGRNMCKINGRLVTVAELKNFMSNYIEIHGQNDNQKLFDSKTHIKYLDNFSGEEVFKLKSEYKEKYQRYNDIKKELKNIEFVDYGTNSRESVDYPDYAFELCKNVVNKNVDLGIAICGSGIGMSIACNKVKGIRCARVTTIKDVKITKIDNNSNVIAFSSDINFDKIKRMIEEFINTPFSFDERHMRRINKISEYEKRN